MLCASYEHNTFHWQGDGVPPVFVFERTVRGSYQKNQPAINTWAAQLWHQKENCHISWLVGNKFHKITKYVVY